MASQLSVPIAAVADYLAGYTEAYRAEYQRFISAPPDGGGYPSLDVSPYLYTSAIHCYVAQDGTAIAEYSREPEYDWYVAGGPALMPDYPDPDSRVPSTIRHALSERGLAGKNIGIYRVCSKTGFPEGVWSGELGEPLEKEGRVTEETSIQVQRFDLTWRQLIQRLTFGAFDLIVDLPLPESSNRFWNPLIIRHMGFVPADRHTRRFFNYLELAPHVDPAAWDTRSIATRVHADLQRDFANAFIETQPGAYLSLGSGTYWPEHFHDRLSVLDEAIKGFTSVLHESPDDESAMQEYLEHFPILLDVYGEAVPRPRLKYPPGDSPLNKTYVEPDFIIKLLGPSYTLIELERPSKRIATKEGRSRADVGQAAFQIAEWKSYIQEHYELIKQRFPGISTRARYVIVIGRDRSEHFGENRDVAAYKRLLVNQYGADDVWTYDDVLARAREAFVRLSSISG